MALIACKECGAQISSNATVCPKCGVSWPASYAKASITFQRAAKFTGIANIMSVSIDDEVVGELPSGGKFSVDVYPGMHTIYVTGSMGGSAETTISVESFKKYTLNVSIDFGLFKASIKIHVL